MRLRVIVLSLALGAAACRIGSADLLTRAYEPNVTDRFYQGSDKAFFASQFDFSGVGNTDGAAAVAGVGRWATLISPSFFVSATHFAPGGSATFYENNNPNGPSHTYTIASGEEIHIGTDPNNQSDLWLGMLSKPVSPSDNIHYYSVAADDEAALVNQPIYVVGAPWRVGTNSIANFQYQTVGPSTGRVFNYNYNGSPTAPATEAFLESGDSGAPSFINVNGQLVLVGVHWYHEFDANNNPVLSGDTFVSQYIDQVDYAMTHDFGPGITEQVTVAPVPEPSSLALIVLGASGLSLALRRRRPAS